MGTKKYTWMVLDKKLVVCYHHYSDDQKVSKFAEPTTMSRWHDEDLRQCTGELNATLDKYRDMRRSESQMLSFLITPKGFFLVWANEVEKTVGEEDDDETIVRELGIKTESSTSQSTENKEKRSSIFLQQQPGVGWKLKKWKKTNGTIKCYGKGKTCAIANIIEPARLTEFHDENLQQCTKELNAILNKYSSKSERPNKELRILSTPEGPFLSWVGTDTLSSEDDAKTILKGLGIE
jgi:hypothetical protein